MPQGAGNLIHKKMTNTEDAQILFIGNWKDQLNNIKAKFSKITDADLFYEKDKKEEMLKRVQIKLGKTREELAYIMSSF